MKNKKCELLVPAGGVKQFIAAVENGADAIYIGGHLFNARINAGNFDDKELQQAVDFAHKRGVKVFVTMNTLITDDELNSALKYAAFLYTAGVDALIIQDFGLGKLIKEYMPDFPLHLSTQATIYDISGVETAERLGYERVVLARELSLDEIKEICENTDAEIEVFVHGALCICYSGQCQLSRYFGGRSGNRGLCAQPCRLPYMTFENKGKLLDTGVYPLSPKDQCLIDYLPALADAGVLSFKIEGRMKSPEYVAVVTSIYRKYLDLYYEKGHYTVDDEDRRKLVQIFNRGGFTDGYLNGDSGMDIMAGDLPKHQGIKIGKVIKRVSGTALVDVKLYDDLNIGDGVEIHGRDLAGNIVTYYKELKGGLTRIGDIKGRLNHGDPLFRISSKEQLDKARATYEYVDFHEGKYLRKSKVDMKLIGTGERLKLAVKNEVGIQTLAEIDIVAETVGNPTSPKRLENALRKTGNTPFEVDGVSIEGECNYAVKSAEINELRRRALSQLENAMAIRRQRPTIIDYVPLMLKKPLAAVELFYYSFESYKEHFVPANVENLDVPKVSLLPAVEFFQHYEEIEDKTLVIPYISSVSRGKEDSIIESNFHSIVKCCRETGIYVGNLSWIQPFRSEGIDVYGDFGLNIYNEQAVAAMDAIGVKRCVYSLESAEKSQGCYPLMILEHEPEGHRLMNKGKPRLTIVSRDFSDQMIIASEIYDYNEPLPDNISEAIRVFVL